MSKSIEEIRAISKKETDKLKEHFHNMLLDLDVGNGDILYDIAVLSIVESDLNLLLASMLAKIRYENGLYK